MSPRNFRVFGSHPEVADPADILVGHPVRCRRDREMAVADIKVERRVDLGVIELHQHVVPPDTELGGAEGNKGGRIAAAYADQVEVRLAGRKTKLTRTGIVKGGLWRDANMAQERHYLAQNSAIWERQDQR